MKAIEFITEASDPNGEDYAARVAQQNKDYDQRMAKYFDPKASKKTVIDYINQYIFGIRSEKDIARKKQNKALWKRLKIFHTMAGKYPLRDIVKIDSTIRNWTSSGYARLNNALRAGKNAPSAKFMDMYIESAPKSPAAVGYRGVDAPFFNTLSAGQVLADPGYMPVTTDEDMAEYFATRKTKGGIIEITGMAGLGAVNYSVVQDEEEIILPRGTKLKIISVDEDTGRGGPVRRAKAKIIK